MKTAFIVGCGALGLVLAALLRDQGWSVRGLRRSPEGQAQLRSAAIDAVTADLDQETSLASIDTRGCTVFYLAPPPTQGEGDPRMLHFLRSQEDSAPECIVYLSTSGVYGDCDGAWVDETHPLQPQTARARRRVAAEQTLQRFSARTGVPHRILRVGGIYGPERLPLARIRAGVTVICPQQAPYSNRIHEYDLAVTCLAAAERGTDGGVYNVADDAPGTMTEYFYQVAQWAALPLPECVDLAQAEGVLSEAMLSYVRESRRLDTRRLREQLGVVLRYPSLKDGLAACPVPSTHSLV